MDPRKYLYAKQDLEKFTPTDIHLLSKYYNVHGDNDADLLWILALRIHSERRSRMPMAASSLGDDINYLESLPPPILITAAIHLDWPSITRICQTSKTLNAQLCDNEDFWRRFILNKAPDYKKSKYITWSGLARGLRNIKRFDLKNQLIEALIREQIDVAKLLLMSEPGEHYLENIEEYINEPWLVDLLILHENPLHIAVDAGYPVIVDKLIAAGADVNAVNKHGVTPLHMAIHGGMTKIIESLLHARADVNKADEHGVTPLYMAVDFGFANIVDKLIAKGADVNKADANGSTPLHIAVTEGATDIVDKLIAAGADVNIADEYKYTPLHMGTLKGATDIVDKLIAAGANVNIVGEYESTPLHMATDAGHLDIVDKLIAAGADVNVVDKYKSTPLHIAVLKNATDIVDKLIAAGAIRK